MAIIIKFVIGIFSYFATFTTALVGARYAIRLALIAFWVASFVVLTAAVNTVLTGVVSVSHPIIQTALTLLPPSTGACIAAIASCRAACWIYVSGVYAASVKARV